jgi:ATP/maltotriose-dependent transcriptional regulator MalT
MGRRDEAVAHFESALALNRHLGARPLVVRTQYEYARVLLDLGGVADATTAVDLARRTETDAEALGMSQVASQARALCVLAARHRR